METDTSVKVCELLIIHMCFGNYIVVFPFFAEKYLVKMQQLNKAIKNASNIRPLLRELDGLREELSILMTMTTPETSRHPNDTMQILKLLKRAKEVNSTIRRDFQIALTVKKELGQVTGFQQKQTLKRRQMLENEMKEATPFVDRAKTVYTDIRQVCSVAISDYRTQPVSEERLTFRPCPTCGKQVCAPVKNDTIHTLMWRILKTPLSTIKDSN